MGRLLSYLPLHFSPGEGGSGGATATETEEEMVEIEVDGEVVASVPKSEVPQIGNLADWRKTLTHDAEEQATVRRKNAADAEAVASDRATFAKERETALDEPAADTEAKLDAVKEAGLTIDDLPNPVDEPAAFAAGLVRKVQEAADAGYQKALTELKKEADTSRKEAQSASEIAAAGERAFAQNERTVDAYVAHMKDEGTPMTEEQVGRLRKFMDNNHRIPQEGFSMRDQASGKTVFTETAVEAADLVIRKDYWRERAIEEGLQDGLKRAGAAGDLTRDMARSAPAKNATPKAKADFALTLNPKAMERYIAQLPEEELNDVMLHIYTEAEQEGATSILRARDGE